MVQGPNWHAAHVPPPRSGAGASMLAGLAWTGGALRRTSATAVDWVLPPTCPACRGLIGSAAGLCSACWAQVRFLERPWCERLGTPLPLDLGPGVLSAAAIAAPPAYARARSAVVYDGIVPDLVQAFKYGDRLDLAPMFASWMLRVSGELLADADLVMPIPLHWRRLLWRRFNQASLLARVVARHGGRPLRQDLLLRGRPTRQQARLGREERAANIRGAFRLSSRAKATLAGTRVLLVDDVLTTGATLDAATRLLLRAGVQAVDVLTLARVIDAE